MKSLVVGMVGVALLVGGFFALNAYIYKEKQGDDSVQQGQPEIEKPKGELVEGGEADPSRMTLGMTTWRWIRSEYNDGTTVRPKQEGQFTLDFGEENKFTATTDCNSMGGTYHVSGEIISFSDVYMTKMFCEGSQEQAFAEMLTNSTSYHFTVRGELILDLKFDSGSVIFR